jgi:hypothetical protein
MGGQAFYLINATDGNLQKSGMAFWFDEDNVSKNIAPDAYIDIQDAGYTQWEGSIQKGEHLPLLSLLTRKKLTRLVWKGEFPNSDIFQTCIVTNGSNIGFGSLSGFARNNNRAWNVYRNDGRLVWSSNGWDYHAIYSCE